MRATFLAPLLAALIGGCAVVPATPPEETPVEGVECYYDGDLDGYGFTTPTTDPDGSCAEAYQSAVSGDCDDSRPDFHPGADEIPGDGFDQDCSGADTRECFVDDDGDGFGAASLLDPDGNCTGDGQSPSGGDCDDGNPDAYPFADDAPGDGIDQSCNGFDAARCFYDGDGDGYGWNDPSGTGFIDDDGLCGDDGTDAPEIGDCDDSRPEVHPGADEVPYDGVDQDCSGGDLVGCYEDIDGDGSGSSVEVPDPDGDCLDAGQSFNQNDCDDDDATIFLFAIEVTDDGIDQDCNGVDASACAYDGDGDGHGALGSLLVELDGDCEDDPFDAPEADDCNDAVASIHPGAAEVSADGFDQDCNGADQVECYEDLDSDGHGAGLSMPDGDGSCVAIGESWVDDDCDDANALRYPNALEVAGDGVDQNCDGVDATACYYDGDGDGFGALAIVVELDGDCQDDATDSNTGTDCNDASSAIHPGAVEIALDGYDQNCDGFDSVLCFVDADGDGAGAGAATPEADGSCGDLGQSWSSGDCDDADAARFPGALDGADDGVDQDCNGVDAASCFYDGDGDGYGSVVPTVELDGSCTDDATDAGNDGDCNDASSAIHPGGTDLPGDGYDQDCSGADAASCYADGDNDGFGAGAPVSVAAGSCGVSGFAQLGTDCDDLANGTYPGALDAPADAIDQDCNGVDAVTCYFDGDGDGYGWTGTFVDPDGSCLDSLTDSPFSTDCDDAISTINPGAVEIVGDSIDQDCNGVSE